MDRRGRDTYVPGGHAIVAQLLPEADPVHKVTIIPRGRAGGYTMMLPEEDRSYETKSYMLAQIRVALGGRAAEQIIFDEISSGASGDLQSVTNIVRQMIMANAAQEVEKAGADVVDINMGCPVNKVVKNQEGSALMKDLPRAEAIIAAVVSAVSLPVTVKMRTGWDADHNTAVELAKRAEQAGAAAVTVHVCSQRFFPYGIFTGRSI